MLGSGAPFLRVVSPDQLDAQERAAQAAQTPQQPLPADLASFVRTRWTIFRNHRNSTDDPLNERLLRAQRMFEGRYDPRKLLEIRKFGGSEVYSRLVAVKCRGATSLLRDVYIGAERPWSIQPEPSPPVPPEIIRSIAALVTSEFAGAQIAGQQVIPEEGHQRFTELMYAAGQAARRNAAQQAALAADKVEGVLEEGAFYDALAEFLVDLPLFPFAVLKGPVVRMVPKLVWDQGKPDKSIRPQMFWERVNPFNFYWSPGAVRISDAEIIERKQLTRTDLNDLLGLPGYDETAVRAALNDYDSGLRDWLDAPDTESALNVGRENPFLNQSQMIDCVEYHGNIQGKKLLEEGLDETLIPDPDRDYAIETWVVGRHTLKTQLNPSPRQRHPYYITSFEKVPGTVLGHGLPDILEDWQEMANATARSLVNNMGIASGPQVVVNTERLSPNETGDQLYPWKRWYVIDDPFTSGSSQPVSFFQPQSNATELISVYNFITATADDISAIPRYATGESLRGGAGRTASGLSMLMNNSSKVLQTVAANVDIDVMRPLLEALYDMVMLTDQSGLLTGNEQIMVNGVSVALQRDAERQKQLQFLQITANPVDTEIVGQLGRARVLRAIAGSMGLPDDIVPDDNTIEQKLQAEKQAAAARTALAGGVAAGGVAAGGVVGRSEASPRGAAGQPDPDAQGDQAAQAQGSQAPHPRPSARARQVPPQNDFQQLPSSGAGRYGP